MAGIVCVVLTVLLSSCSPKLPVLKESKQTESESFKTHYSIIFFIHGDNDYLYRDAGNNEYNADVETVMNAKKIAEQNPNAEVFIFHQKPKTNFLFFSLIGMVNSIIIEMENSSQMNCIGATRKNQTSILKLPFIANTTLLIRTR